MFRLMKCFQGNFNDTLRVSEFVDNSCVFITQIIIVFTLQNCCVCFIWERWERKTNCYYLSCCNVHDRFVISIQASIVSYNYLLMFTPLLCIKKKWKKQKKKINRESRWNSKDNIHVSNKSKPSFLCLAIKEELTINVSLLSAWIEWK